jgi:uncharacterized membrane protein
MENINPIEHASAEHAHDPENQSAEPKKETHHEKNVPMAILAYIGPLVIISYLVAKDDPFVKFHVKQGLALVAIEVILWILTGVYFGFWMIYNVVHLGIIILSILGILNAIQKRERKLPLIGDLADHFKF